MLFFVNLLWDKVIFGGPKYVDGIGLKGQVELLCNKQILDATIVKNWGLFYDCELIGNAVFIGLFYLALWLLEGAKAFEF